jgi:hypothetical protein
VVEIEVVPSRHGLGHGQPLGCEKKWEGLIGKPHEDIRKRRQYKFFQKYKSPVK